MKTSNFIKRTPFLALALAAGFFSSCSKKELPQPEKCQTAEKISAVSCNADLEATIDVVNGNWTTGTGEMVVYRKVGSQYVEVGSTALTRNGTGAKSVFFSEVIDDDNATDVALKCCDVPLETGVTYYFCPVLNGPVTSPAWGGYPAVYLPDEMLEVTFTSASHGKLRFDYVFDMIYPGTDVYNLTQVGANISVSTVSRPAILP